MVFVIRSCILLNSSGSVCSVKVFSKSLISWLVLSMVFSQNLMDSSMSSVESACIFLFQVSRNSKSWFPMDGLRMTLKLVGVRLSFMQVLRKSRCDSKRAIFSLFLLSLMAEISLLFLVECGVIALVWSFVFAGCVSISMSLCCM